MNRHIYQNSNGGKVYCPLECGARMIHDSSPKFARQVSSKYGNLSASKVQRDLRENHNRRVSQDYIKSLANDVGRLIEQQEQNWSYVLPLEAIESQLVSIGRDGTTAYIRGDCYREVMNGSISFYNEVGDRVHSIYLAQAPEYGKATFNERFLRQIERVKACVKANTYIGLADGAVDNWTFLEPITQISILDFWHASEYLTLASKATSKSAYERKQWLEQARHILRHEYDGAAQLLEQMKGFKRKRKLSKVAKESLEKAITYFENHHHQMDYARHAEQNIPIGSGVTEAACKVIVKERLGQSGMKWKIDGAQKTLTIRALYHSGDRWQQFWQYVDRFAFCLN